MKTLRHSKLKNGVFFQGNVALMIGLTLQLGFVQAAPRDGIQTAENASDVYEAAVRGNPLGNPKSEARSPRQIRTPKSEPEFGKRKALIHAHPRSLAGRRHAGAEVPFTFRVDPPGERVPLRSAKMCEDQQFNHGFQAETRDAASEVAARGLSDSDGWLDPTVDADFNDRFIQEKLAEIGPGVTNAFEFVRDQIGYEAYDGSLRGARGTMWSQAGNSLDQASLLIALLRGQGIGARYVRGTLSTNDARLVIQSMFKPEPLANAVGYVPDRFPLNDPLNDPGLIGWVSDHWWVELEDGTQLDPCFADAAVNQIYGASSDIFFEVPNPLRHKVIVRLQAELHNPLSQYTHETPLEVELATVEVYGKALTLGHFIGVYQPPALFGGYKTYTYSPYLMVDDNDADLENNHLVQGTDYQEFLTSGFPLANSTLTRLTLEFEVRDPGREPDIRRRDILDRVGFAARHGLAQPGPVDTSRPALTELDLVTFFITPGFLAPDVVPPFQNALAALDPQLEALSPRVAALTNKAPNEITGPELNDVNRYMTLNQRTVIAGGGVVAGAFQLASDYYLRVMRNSHRTLAYYNSPRITLFEAHTPKSLDDGTLRMGLDLRCNHVFTLPYPGQNALNRFTFNMAKGKVDSILESQTMEHFLAEDFPEVQHVASPIRVLQAAKQQGVQMVHLQGEQDVPIVLERLEISPEAKARIALALKAGRQINVPERMIAVDGRSSIGWWEIDMETGEVVAVGEDGGNQDLFEFGVILAVIGVPAIAAGSILGDNIERMFAAENSNSRQYAPIDPLNPPGPLAPPSDQTARVIANNELIKLNEEGKVTFQVNDIVLTGKMVNNLNEVFDTAGSGGSIIDFAGTDIEVIATYAPNGSDLSGSMTNSPDTSLKLIPEPAFVVKHHETQVPSAYRACIGNTGSDDANYVLGGMAPTGWQFLLPQTNLVITAGATGQVSVFLQPKDETPLPAPGTGLDFELTVAREPTSGAAKATELGLPVTFVMPEVHRVRLLAAPEELFSSPNGTHSIQLVTANMGNVPETVELDLPVPAGFHLEGAVASLNLVAGQSVTQAVSLVAENLPTESDYRTTWTETYGPTNAITESVALTLHGVAPGVHPAIQAGADARAAGREGMAGTLEALALDLSALYGTPTDTVSRSRVLAGLTALLRQLNDPSLAPFAADLETARADIEEAAPGDLPQALESLGLALDPLAARLQLLAEHDFTLALRPNVAEALPQTPTQFRVALKNRGRQTTTYHLEFSGVPAGITSVVEHADITLAPGATTTTAGATTPAITLTQPSNALTAFEFTVTATVVGQPELSRSAPGSFAAREELARVTAVEVSPPFLEPFHEETEVLAFTGGDPGEGLDLEGEFLYAVNFGVEGAIGSAGDAVFTSDEVSGVTFTARYDRQNWGDPDFGNTAADDTLEAVLRSIRLDPQPWEVHLNGLTPGRTYTLQLLFTETGDPARYFDVEAGGRMLVQAFNPSEVGGFRDPARGAVIRHRFLATNDTFTIRLGGQHADWPPILNALTLEQEPPLAAEVSARVLNAVNADRTVSAEFTLFDPLGQPIYTSPQQPVNLSVLSSLDTFSVGAYDAAGLAAGTYPVTVTLYETDGGPIPGASGSGSLLIGMPVAARLTAAPELLPPGESIVTNRLEVSARQDFEAEPLMLVGLTDTAGTAENVAVHGDYAYVGGSENLSIVDVSDPLNPRVLDTLGDDSRWAAVAGEHLVVRRGLDLDVYSLDHPAQPALIGSAASGVSQTVPADFVIVDNAAHLLTVVMGNNAVDDRLQFVRGDLLSFDLSSPTNPYSLGLLFDTPHTEFPQYPGSDFYLGTQTASKDGVLYLAGSTEPTGGLGGTGRLVLVDVSAPGSVVTNGEFLVPGTTMLAGIAVQNDRALVVGSTEGFADYGFRLEGDVVLAVLDVSKAAQPALVGTPLILSDSHLGAYWTETLMRVTAGTNGLFVLTGVQVNGKEELLVVDTLNPGQLRVYRAFTPTPVTWTEIRGRLLYATSSAGLAIYDLGGMMGIPVTAGVRVSNINQVAILSGSFSQPPDEIVSGTDYDTLIWHTRLWAEHTNEVITWQSRITDLGPGELQRVTDGGTVEFEALGMKGALALPALQVSGAHILTLDPPARAVRLGQSADYRLTLTNVTGTDATYTLNITGLPSEWLNPPAPVWLPAHSQTAVGFKVQAHAGAAIQSCGFTVTANSATAPSDTVGGKLTLLGPMLTSWPAHGVMASLDPPQAVAGQGTPARFAVRLVNTGNTDDTYALSASVPAGFRAQFSATNLEVPPGLDNYREIGLTVTPAPGTTAGHHPIQVTATCLTDASAEDQTTGSIQVINLGVTLGLSPASVSPGGTFTLVITNTGQESHTFDLALGGPVAPSVTLPTTAVTLAAGAGQTLFIPVVKLDYGYPGELALTVLATARDNTNVQARASAAVTVPPEHGVTAQFEPLTVRLPGPGTGFALLTIRNSGNAEDAFTARIIGVAGPLTASLQGPNGQPVQQIDTFRLPGLNAGVVLLKADMGSAGTGTVQVVVSSLLNSNVSAHATVRIQSGVRLRIAPEWIAELTFAPLPGKDHYFEYTESLQRGLVDWKELPGGPYNRGWYYLALPGNCAAFAPDLSDTNRLFLECAVQPSRFYRLRVEGGSAPALRGHLFQVSALKFNPVPGFDHVVQYTDKLGPEAHWIDLPRGPHNHGLAFDPRTEIQRFYRVVIRPQSSP